MHTHTHTHTHTKQSTHFFKMCRQLLFKSGHKKLKSAYKKLKSAYKKCAPYVFPFRFVQSANNEFLLKKDKYSLDRPSKYTPF